MEIILAYHRVIMTTYISAESLARADSAGAAWASRIAGTTCGAWSARIAGTTCGAWSAWLDPPHLR